MRLILILLVLLTVSCKTVQQKADRHILKAIQLDSTVISRVETQVIFRDTINFHHEFLIPGFEIEKTLKLPVFLANIEANGSAMIIDESGVNLTARLDSMQNLTFDLSKEQDTLKKDTTIYIEKLITVPGTGVRIPTRIPIWKYWEFWVVLAYGVSLTILIFKK